MDGLTVWLPNMAAVSREPQMWPLQVLDVLGYLDEIPDVWDMKLTGSNHRIPNHTSSGKGKTGAGVLPGWKCDIRGIKKYEDLPENCRKYIEFVEEKLGFPHHHDLQRTKQRRYYL